MQTHLPGYITDYDKLTKAGAQVIACVAVNDAFVMTAWGEQAGAKDKVPLSAHHFQTPLLLCLCLQGCAVGQTHQVPTFMQLCFRDRSCIA